MQKIVSTTWRKLRNDDIFNQRWGDSNAESSLQFHENEFDMLRHGSLSTEEIEMIYFQKKKDDFRFTFEKVLSPSGDLCEAATNLFSFYHDLEKESLL